MIEYTVKVFDDGTKEWYLNDELHREDGPAIDRANGDKHWYLNGELHRTDGPAIKYANGNKEWYINGVLTTEEGFNTRTTAETFDGKVIEFNGKRFRIQEI